MAVSSGTSILSGEKFIVYKDAGKVKKKKEKKKSLIVEIRIGSELF